MGPGRAATAAAAAAPAALLAAGGADPAEAMLPAGPAAGLRSHGEFTVGGASSLPFVCFFGCVCFCAIWVWFGVATAFHGVTMIGAVSFLLLARFVLVLAAYVHKLRFWFILYSMGNSKNENKKPSIKISLGLGVCIVIELHIFHKE